jgi:hypothetical protein
MKITADVKGSKPINAKPHSVILVTAFTLVAFNDTLKKDRRGV